MMVARILLVLAVWLGHGGVVPAQTISVPSPYQMVQAVSFIGEGRLSMAGTGLQFTVDHVIKGLSQAGDVLKVIEQPSGEGATIAYFAKAVEGQPVVLFGDLTADGVTVTFGSAGIWPQGLHRKTFPADTVDDAREFVLALLSYQALGGQPQALVDRLIKDATTERRYAAVEFADQALPQLPQFQDSDTANDIVTAVMTDAWRASPGDPYLDEKFLQLSPRISPSIALPEMARIAGQTGSRADQARNLLEQNLRIRDMIEGEGWTLPSLNRAVEENLDFLRGIDGEQALKLLDNPMPAARAAGERVLKRVIQTENQTQGPPEPKPDLETWRRRLEPLRRLELETMTIEEAR